MTATPNPRGNTLLVVDDDALIREVVQAMLEDAGYAVRGAASGKEAVEALEQDGTDIRCILLDLVLPGSKPQDVVAAIRARAPATPVIMASGRSAEEVGEAVERLGCTSFIRKPFGAQELLTAVRGALGD